MSSRQKAKLPNRRAKAPAERRGSGSRRPSESILRDVGRASDVAGTQEKGASPDGAVSRKSALIASTAYSVVVHLPAETDDDSPILTPPD